MTQLMKGIPFLEVTQFATPLSGTRHTIRRHLQRSTPKHRAVERISIQINR